MNHICKLPDELLLKILQCIPPPKPDLKDKPYMSWGVTRVPLSDYFAVSLVCRRMSRITTGIMFAHYDHEIDYISSAPFIRAMLQNPSSAQSLKSLREIGPADEGFENAVAGTRLERYKRSAASIDSLRAAIQKLTLPDSDDCSQFFQKELPIGRDGCKFFESGSDQDLDLEAALIIALAPNIQSIALNCDPHLAYIHTSHTESRRPKPLSLRMMTYAASPNIHKKVHEFKHLRKLTINMAGMYLSFISGILRLESLTDLMLFTYKEPGMESGSLDSSWECPPKGSKVRTMRLHDFDIHHTYLTKLISSCQKLDEFSLSASKLASRRPDYFRLVSELHKYHPGLQALNIARPQDSFQTLFDDDSATVCGSFEHFEDLRYLAAPLEILVNPSISDPNLHLGNLLPQSLRTFVLSKGGQLFSNVTSVTNQKFDRKLCDKHVQSVVDACQLRLLCLKAFGIRYQTDFRYPDVPGGYANTSKDLARMDDVDFDFYKFTCDFERCGVHFDYVIKVAHGKEHEAHERLISVRRINGDAIADEYSYHLHSTFDAVPHYELAGFEQPRFLDTEGEEFIVHRKKMPWELRKEV